MRFTNEHGVTLEVKDGVTTVVLTAEEKLRGARGKASLYRTIQRAHLKVGTPWHLTAAKAAGSIAERIESSIGGAR